MNVRIPKIIMQTWKTSTLPEKWQASQDSIKKYMPDWQYILMTDEDNRNFVEKHFPDFLSFYDKFTYPIMRADAIRYCWLYINGGIYIDCDYELQGSLESLFYEEQEHNIYLLPSAHVSNVITNSFMASAPGQQIWLDMIESMKKPPSFLYTLEKHLYVMYTTGPSALTKVAAKHTYNRLPSDKLNPYTMCDRVYDKEGVLLKPLEGSSWVSGTGKVIQWCYCNNSIIWVWIIAIIVIILFLIICLYYR